MERRSPRWRAKPTRRSDSARACSLRPNIWSAISCSSVSGLAIMRSGDVENATSVASTSTVGLKRARRLLDSARASCSPLRFSFSVTGSTAFPFSLPFSFLLSFSFSVPFAPPAFALCRMVLASAVPVPVRPRATTSFARTSRDAPRVRARSNSDLTIHCRWRWKYLRRTYTATSATVIYTPHTTPPPDPDAKHIPIFVRHVVLADQNNEGKKGGEGRRGTKRDAPGCRRAEARRGWPAATPSAR